MVIGRWNYDKQDYEPYKVGDDWHMPLYCENMDEIVNCACCGRKITYGACYTSRELHTGKGLGYPVCPTCYDTEVAREDTYRRKGQ